MRSSNKTRALYLIRHCHTGENGRCISATDTPLDEFGEHQARQLANWAADKNLAAVYSSPLSRTVKTAGAITAGRIPAITRDELREVDVGLWEGLEFEEIKKRFPEDFIKRGEHPGTYAPTGGESIFEAGLRLLECLHEIISDSRGNIVVVSHGGSNRGALCKLLGRHPDEALLISQPWGGISEIEVLPDGQMSVKSIGEMPDRYPDSRSVEWLCKRFKMPEHVAAHCDAVAKKAVQLAKRINLPVDLGLLYSAALLHDLSRAYGLEHAAEGARLMRESGYPDVSEIIAYHHDLQDCKKIEAQILYLADKLIQDDREVTLRKRFEESRKKCTTAEALDAWRLRYDATVGVAQTLGLEADRL